MTILVDWKLDESTEPFVADEEIRRAVAAALRHGERSELQVQVVLCSEQALTALHERFLDDATPTDVITFDLGDDEDDDPSAEIYVSVDMAKRVAAEYSQSVENELLLYVVHGTLHLCGFDDHEQEERRRMRLAEASVFEALGIPFDRARHESL